MSSGTLNNLPKVPQMGGPRAATGFVLDVDQVRQKVFGEMVRVAGECARFAAQAADLLPFVGYGV